MPRRTSEKTTHQTNTDRRKEAERLHRRTHILLAAERVFGRLPYDQASMQEVASEAGIGMKGLYEHFSSKEALLSEVIVFRLGEIDEQLKATRKTADPLRRLRDLAVAFSAFFLERPHFYPLFATQKICADWDLGSRLTDAARLVLKQMEAEVVKAMEAACKAGLMVPMEPKLLAAIAVGFFTHVTQYQLLVKAPASAESCADELAAALFFGIGKRV
jgi:AcrR family transcriptional regulator